MVTSESVSRRLFVNGQIPGKANDPELSFVTKLHSSLDIENVLLFFAQALVESVQCDGLIYEHPATQSSVTLGNGGAFKLHYQLEFDEEYIGDLTIMRIMAFAPDDVKCVEEQLNLLLMPLRNAVNFTSAVESARHDPLTGMRNRATLDDELAREIKLSVRHNQDLSLVILDLDDFKVINDTYGHLAGDLVLKNVATTIRSLVRETDLVYRFGGEEFLTILSNTKLDGAKIMGERLRAALESSNQDYQNQRLKVTASIGIATLEPGDSLSSFLDRADQALYRAKAGGKNQVQI